MKYLIYAGILGFSCWGISEVIEIFSGYTPSVYYLTASYHFFAGFGIWALHKIQSAKNNLLSQIGAVIILITYLGLTYFPIQVMNSGLSISEFLAGNTLYKLVGGIWFLGMMLFGISILKTKFYPFWTGIIFILGTIFFVSILPLTGSSLLLNLSNLLFSISVLYLLTLGMKNLKGDYLKRKINGSFE
ncbi:hypothetical protein AAGF08_13985 [Algoriphagus sp. SE2]|uniref:hypothetical protein n=1 Tax=Algoriphagus sp. SE2 TaxID=3141536 RepID=UPI0031CD8B78